METTFSIFIIITISIIAFSLLVPKIKDVLMPNRQTGGFGSDYVDLFYARSPVDSRKLDEYTRQHLDQSPMFNPLKLNTTIPTIATGIIPTGAYYLSVASPTIVNPTGSLNESKIPSGL